MVLDVRAAETFCRFGDSRGNDLGCSGELWSQEQRDGLAYNTDAVWRATSGRLRSERRQHQQHEHRTRKCVPRAVSLPHRQSSRDDATTRPPGSWHHEDCGERKRDRQEQSAERNDRGTVRHDGGPVGRRRSGCRRRRRHLAGRDGGRQLRH